MIIHIIYLQIRFVAVRASTSFILAYEKDATILSHFKDLAPIIIQVNKFIYWGKDVFGFV